MGIGAKPAESKQERRETHPAEAEPPTVLIADPHPVIRAALGAWVRTTSDARAIVGTDSTTSAIDLMANWLPTVLILSGGVDPGTVSVAIDFIGAKTPSTKMIVIGNFDHDSVPGLRISRAGHSLVGLSATPTELDKVLRSAVGGSISAIPSVLSAREVEVLKMAARGFSNRSIGERLFISSGTVKRHLANTFERLGVHSRVQAINRAQSLGYLTDDLSISQ